ncbi:MAG: amino acid adenylation domain-containing protein [Saccharofermentans sp.]|nr:amino acid adenylation domain-containing protein [Saccharofermentans sp.]
MVRTHLLDYFESTVAVKSDKIAVRHNDNDISFKELKDKAQRFASLLLAAVGDVTNTPVAVFLPKEINAVIADLGIMYTSNPFMNLDVKTPKERIMNIFELVKPAAVITSKKFSKVLDGITLPVVFIDEVDWEGIAVDEALLLSRRSNLIDTDPFCLINTSGSTGTPKGVVLNHRSFFDFMAVSNERFKFDGSEIMGSLSPIVFDIYDFELCMLMCNGSQIVLLDAMLAAFPARLLEKMADYHVNFIFWVPSIMVNIANMGLLDKISLPDLKLVWFAGEVFPTKQFLVWYDKLPNTKFANLYGPIEITLDCTYYVVEERPVESEPLPIGIPYHNTDVLLLNDNNKKCDIGEEGELCVRGTSLAMGYYNNPEKTAAAFTQNPLNTSYPELIYRTGDMAYMREDGNIMFKGRKDSLIKHMGYRIELGEIEHVIENDLKLVEYCCAVYQYEKKEIVLYYQNGTELTDKDFRTALSKVFPAYMIPASYINMEELPRNTNGKIDRLILKNLANNTEN